MSGRIPSVEELAEQVSAFAQRIEPAKERWEYCLTRVKQSSDWRGDTFDMFAPRTIAVCGRILGRKAHASAYRFRRLDDLGYDAAKAEARVILDIVPYSAGPLERWHLGHVYFVRVDSHPHVLKIGFSRRVRDRLEDIESKCKTGLHIRPGHIKVGTLADEHWWHNNWRNTRISGEWFFDPKSTDRSLPSFLQVSEDKAA